MKRRSADRRRLDEREQAVCATAARHTYSSAVGTPRGPAIRPREQAMVALGDAATADRFCDPSDFSRSCANGYGEQRDGVERITATGALKPGSARSEERRVGKEC